MNGGRYLFPHHARIESLYSGLGSNYRLGRARCRGNLLDSEGEQVGYHDERTGNPVANSRVQELRLPRNWTRSRGTLFPGPRTSVPPPLARIREGPGQFPIIPFFGHNRPQRDKIGSMRTGTLATAFIFLGILQAHSKTRDLSQYEAIGPFNLLWTRASHELGTIREFLWEHWNEKRRGVVRVREQWVEGISDTTYFVEPDKRGRWAIVESSGGTERSCDQVERVEPNRLRVPVIPIPNAESRNPEQYLLHPKCWKDRPYATLW